MSILKRSASMGAVPLALGINIVSVSMATGARGPCTNDGHAMGKRDPYVDGGCATCDVYTDGAHSMSTHGPYTDGGHR